MNCQPPLAMYNSVPLGSGCESLAFMRGRAGFYWEDKGTDGIFTKLSISPESNMCLGQSNTSPTGGTGTIRAKTFLPRCPAAPVTFLSSVLL